MGKIIRNGIEYCGTSDTADNIIYNNKDSGLTATNTQTAIDELSEKVKNGGSNIVYLTKEQYEALPDTKLTDDVEYRITDANTVNKIDATDVTYGEGSVEEALDGLSDSLKMKTYPLNDEFTTLADIQAKIDELLNLYPQPKSLKAKDLVIIDTWGYKYTIAVTSGTDPIFSSVFSHGTLGIVITTIDKASGHIQAIATNGGTVSVNSITNRAYKLYYYE